MILFRPQDWLIPELARYEVINVVAITALLALLIDIMTGEIKIPDKLPALWLGIGIFVGICMSHIAHTFLAGLTGSFEDYGKKFIFYLLVILTVNSVRRIKILVLVMTGAALIMATHCILQIHRGYGFTGRPPLYQKRPVGESGEFRMQARAYFFGTFEDPNDTALFLIPLCPLLLGIFSKKLWILVLPVVGYLLYGAYLTDSRGGMLGAIVLVLCLFHRFFNVKWTLIVLAGLTIGVTMATPLAGSLGLIDDSSLDRAIFWGEANYIFKSSITNLLFGVGYAMLSSDYLEKDRAVHNSFVLSYTETGVFGYFFWFTLLAFVVFSAWYISRWVPENKKEKSLVRFAYYLVPALAGSAASAYFLTRAFHLSWMLMMALGGATYTAMADRIGWERLNVRMRITPRYWPIWFGMSLGSILFIYFTIRLINSIR